MGFRLRPPSSCTRASPLPNLQVLPLLALLLTALVPTEAGRRKRNLGKDEGGKLLPFSLCPGGLWCVCGEVGGGHKVAILALLGLEVVMTKNSEIYLRAFQMWKTVCKPCY